MTLFRAKDHFIVIADKETREAAVEFAKLHKTKEPISLIGTTKETVVAFDSRDGVDKVFESAKAKFNHLYDVRITPEVIFIKARES